MIVRITTLIGQFDLRRIGLWRITRGLERRRKGLVERLALVFGVGGLAVIRVDHGVAHLDLRQRSRRRRDVLVVQARFR